MELIPITTTKLIPPKDDLFAILDASLLDLRDGDIVLITSKVVALHQGRCLKVEDVADKDELIRAEAERYIDRAKVPGAKAVLTLKHHTLIASAGIDESNGNGYYILWPENIDEVAQEIRGYLQRRHGIKNIGVILTDSHTIPLRFGVLGISISHSGFEPLVDLRGKVDLFGRQLAMTRQNIPDALAGLGVLLMGESDECQPLLIVRGFPVVFTDADTNAMLRVEPDQDIYKPLLDVFSRSRSTHR